MLMPHAEEIMAGSSVETSSNIAHELQSECHQLVLNISKGVLSCAL